jgi:hypothetical protein
MRPLSPEERAEILALNPGATEADVAAYDELLVERGRLAAAPVATAAARLAEVDRALDELASRALPRWDEAMAAVAARAAAADDDDGAVA